MAPGKGGWMSALLFAALLHLFVAAAVFWSPTQKPQGQARAQGSGGVEISLGPAGQAAGSRLEQNGKQTPEQPVEPELAPKPEPSREPPSEPVPESQPEPVKEVKPEPVIKKKPENSTQPVNKPVAKPEASVTGAAGKSGTKNENNTGSGDNTAGGGLPGISKDYAATLLAWLERHKEYPRRARLRRQQGTVLLYFMVNRQGQVLDYRIKQSSGYSVLDDEVQRMIVRAQPLPPMPESMQQEQLELVVPVQFFLR